MRRDGEKLGKDRENLETDCGGWEETVEGEAM